MQSWSRGKSGGLGNPPHKATFGGNFLLVYRKGEKKKGFKGKRGKKAKNLEIKDPNFEMIKKKRERKKKIKLKVSEG